MHDASGANHGTNADQRAASRPLRRAISIRSRTYRLRTHGTRRTRHVGDQPAESQSRLRHARVPRVCSL